MRIIKKIIKNLMILVLLVFVIVIIAFIPIGNNLIASNISKRLKETTLPEKTEFIDSASKAGKFTGNGNGMQYFGAILIKSDLDLKELQNYYSQYRENDWSFLVLEQQSSQIKAIGSGDLKFHALKDIVNFKGYYIVYSFGDNDNELFDFDLRGH